MIRTSGVNRTRIASILAATLLVSGDAWGSGGGANQARGAAETQIAQLVRKHGANTAWTDSVRKATGSTAPFAFELQNAFDPLIGRPILAVVTVDDIYRTIDGYRLICHLSSSHPTSSDWENLYFVLDLSAEKARELADIPDSRFSEVFAIVIVPTRADVRVSREVEALRSESTDDGTTLDVGRPSGGLWVRGTCLDVEHLLGY